MDLETLVVSFGADLAGLTAGVAGAKALLVGFGLGAIGVGVAAVKMAGDFQAGMTTIKTGAGGVNENIAQLSQQVLGLSTASGTGTKGLIDGLFMIESAGQRGKDAMQTLTMAAEGAKVGGADLGVVANGVTTIMTDFASSNITAAQATNTLVATVSAGKTHMQDLSAALATVLPTASNAKVGLNDVMGAMATMTGAGIPAADAATYLRQMISTLASPATAGAKALKEIGLSAQQVSDSMKVSLPDTLKMIEEHLKNKFPEGSIAYQKALKDIAGGSKQMQGMLDLTGDHLKIFGQNVKDIAGKVKQGGDSIVGWSDVQGDFNFKMDQARASAEVFMITLGTKLLPLLGPIVSNIANVVGSFTAWINSAHPLTDALSLTGKYAQIALPILAGLGALVLSVIVPAFWAWAAAMIANPIGLIIVGIALGVAGLTAAFVHFYQSNAGFRALMDNIGAAFRQAASFIQVNFMPAMAQVGDFLKAYVLPILKQIGDFVVSQFVPVWQQLVTLWTGQLLPLFQQLWGAIQPLMPIFQAIGVIVGGVVVGAFILLMGIFQGVVAAVATVAHDIGSAIGGIVQVITGVVQVISGILQFVSDLFHGNWKALGADLAVIWQGVVNVFGGIFQTLGSIVHAIFGGIGSFISGFASGILNTLGNILGGADKMRLQAEMKQNQSAVAAITTKEFETKKVLAVEEQKRLGILKELENTKDPKKRHELEMQLAAITTKEQETQGILQSEDKKKNELLKKQADLKKQMDDANKSMVQKALDWFGQLKDGAVQKMLEMGLSIGGKFTDIKNWVGNFFSSFGTFWHDKWQGLVDAAKGILAGVIGGVKWMVNGVIDGINNLINGVNRVSGAIGIPAIPNIPHFAAGTNFAPGGLALVGEKGPEVVNLPRGSQVIPNSHLTSGSFNAAQSSQQAPIIHIHNHINIDGREMTESMMVHALSEMRSAAYPGGNAA